MNYSIAGFVFYLNLDSSGNVTSVTTPQLGPLAPQSIAFNPSATVPEVQTFIYGLLQLLGLV